MALSIDAAPAQAVSSNLVEIPIQNENCGGNNKCYNFVHGPEGSEKTIILRSASDFIEVGECATFVGPVSSFPGPLADGAGAQLDSTNFDWYRGPFREQ